MERKTEHYLAGLPQELRDEGTWHLPHGKLTDNQWYSEGSIAKC